MTRMTVSGIGLVESQKVRERNASSLAVDPATLSGLGQYLCVKSMF